MNSTGGAVYLLVGIRGLFLVGSALNIIALNGADNVLHLASAVVLLGVAPSQDKVPANTARAHVQKTLNPEGASVSAHTAASVGPTAGASVTLFSCFAGMGAGLVELSIASSYISSRGPLMWAGGIAAAWGLALLAASIASLQRGRLRFHKPMAIALIAAVPVHVTVLVAGLAQRALDGGHLAALFLILMALGSSAWLARRYREDDGGTAAAPPRAGALVGAAFAAAVVVAAVTTPGLAASVAGQQAVPPAGHSLPVGHNH